MPRELLTQQMIDTVQHGPAGYVLTKEIREDQTDIERRTLLVLSGRRGAKYILVARTPERTNYQAVNSFFALSYSGKMTMPRHLDDLWIDGDRLVAG